jgi:hypothetical protein
MTKPSGWSDWSSLGGQVTLIPAVVKNADGLLEVFVRSTDENLYHKWQTTPDSNSWSDWDLMGGPIGRIAVEQSHSGLLEVFVLTDMSDLKWGELYHIYQSKAGGPYLWY